MDDRLRHLAFVFDGFLPGSGKAGLLTEAAGLVDHFTALADHSFSRLTGLESLSFFYPEFQEAILSGTLPPADFEPLRAKFDTARSVISRRGAALHLLGFPDLLPGPWAKLVSPSPPAPSRSRKVNFFLGYGGREEIARAAEDCIVSRSHHPLDEEDLGNRLLTAGQADPDFIVFAGADFRPRDFLVWQASYAEIWHSPRAGRDFSPAHLEVALENFGGRERRFGKV